MHINDSSAAGVALSNVNQPIGQQDEAKNKNRMNQNNMSYVCGSVNSIYPPIYCSGK